MSISAALILFVALFVFAVSAIAMIGYCALLDEPIDGEDRGDLQ
jgi:hypothetical protein